jgi:hypothetical protein
LREALTFGLPKKLAELDAGFYGLLGFVDNVDAQQEVERKQSKRYGLEIILVLISFFRLLAV